ncbi:hypothetical protein EZY14_013720 [Kordia sp. TARA_039_SRF]|nr:hypothetical protein EZY14_013720 [Kordia sp. TARA_039_SRF]
MRYFIVVFLMVCFSKTHAQGQSQFFVDDVESIEYVTVNFCVDNEAKISKVTVKEEETTYKNTENIERIRQYLLGIQYYPNSKLKNNCYDSTFKFINYTYQEKKLTEKECNLCEKFKKGFFEYDNFQYRDTKIKRTKKIQKELSKDGSRLIYEIKWLSNCIYLLTQKRTNTPRLKHLKGEEILVEIIDLLDDGSYVYKTEATYDKDIIYGIIKKIEE